MARFRTAPGPSEGHSASIFSNCSAETCRGSVACLERQIGGTAPSSPARISPSPVRNRNKLRMAVAGFWRLTKESFCARPLDKISNLRGGEVAPVDWLIRKNTDQQSPRFPPDNVGGFPRCSRAALPDADRSRPAPLRLIQPTIKPKSAVVHKSEFRSILLPATRLVARRHSQNYAEKIKLGRLQHPRPTAPPPTYPAVLGIIRYSA